MKVYGAAAYVSGAICDHLRGHKIHSFSLHTRVAPFSDTTQVRKGWR